MRIQSFDEQFDLFVIEQKKLAAPRRLEMLERDLSGTKRMFKKALFPVFQTFAGFELEYELTGPGGVKIYIDTMYAPFGFAFEFEGFSAHAETITRERFSFEKSRVRTMLLSGCVYIPFTWDELDKKSDQCRSFVYELVNKYSSNYNLRSKLTPYEREVIRFALTLSRPICLADICVCLGKKKDLAYKVIRSLVDKKLLQLVNEKFKRNQTYILTQNAIDFIR